mmetsp:Transcript_7536/g.11397  ORF Transcript_7536/g.11397 Transcript_7536/m.11397 type:complete len:526 (+) Transcript_7536:175-1752(+)|eukprot:CAMPEP_0195292588 /NCGR_PEP_ID=MMETSP0707-20130614/10216_1 /TAXON_ID=33640 /ORGANISM="Asterionellopsis glacialis, Strain CCMP134" /LENGTH=525 /DNA_ID=CAMNT_0040353087 /DNA_START=88 /DNA_END=1668 /DNA_ORIENTATION=-
MVKSRVGIRLKESIVGANKSSNRSGDLDALVERYKLLRSKLKALILALRNKHAIMTHVVKANEDVANQIANFAEHSPLNDCTCLLPSSESAPGSVISFRSVHADLKTRTDAYVSKYNQFIVEYAVEWDKVVEARVSTGIRETERLRRDLSHYQGKVESLRASTNQTLSKGKQVKADTAEKLGRNEEKLVKAKEDYNKFATDMCVLIEEVTERSWKDLHPMLVKICQFDATMSADEAKQLAYLNQVVEQLKQVAEQHGGLTPQGRIKDLAEKQPRHLHSGGARSSNMIEAGAHTSAPMGGDAAYTANMYDDQARPPGTVAPQGMGGFPVRVSSNDNRSRTSSYASYDSGNGADSTRSPPSTSEMLAMTSNAAPPPSWDQVNEATNNLSISNSRGQTLRGSGTLPPRGPSSGNNNTQPDWSKPANFSSNASLASMGSASYGAAPAPAAPPPPPPPAASYTPASNSMYSNIPVATAVPTSSAPDPPSYGAGHSSYQADPPAHPWSSGRPPAPGSSGSFGAGSTNPFDD